MPALTNHTWERMAQEMAKGKSQSAAYKIASGKENRSYATDLSRKPCIIARVTELISERDRVERSATEKAAARLSITKERVLSELAKIGFSDVRRAVKWASNIEAVGKDKKGKEVLQAFNDVALVDSDKLDDDTAAAISEISKGRDGALRVKLYDKRAALIDIGKELGMFIDRHMVGSPDEFARLSDDELREFVSRGSAEIGGGLGRAAHARETEETPPKVGRPH